MKKLFLLTCLVILQFAVAQKKKATVKKVEKNVVVATLENLSAEIATIKKVRKFVLFAKNEQSTDTLVLKESIDKNFKPEEFNVKNFSIGAQKMYLISWKENNTTTDKNKTEIAAITENQVWNPQTKKQLFTNTEKSTQIKEKVFLDVNKTASQDVERKTLEGSLFTLLTNGDVTLYSKAQQAHFVYNAETDQYESKKVSAPSVSKSNTKAKKR